MTLAPVRAIALGPREVEVVRTDDGVISVRASQPLADYPRRFTDRFEHWANVAPERVWIAQRDPVGAWRTVTYADGLARMCRIAQALLDRKLSPERPIVILSDNDIEHALLALAALHIGVPFAAISSAYSLVSTDYGKLRHVIDRITPGLVFAADGTKFAKAIRATVPATTELVLTSGSVSGYATTWFGQLESTVPTAAVKRAAQTVEPDTVAKFLFTSGSTGNPKAVITTQRMLCSNLQMVNQTLPFLAEMPPVIVDWLPWNHVFGGNHNYGIVIYNGGTLYIDEGRPVTGAFARSLANLREIAPTAYFNVPRGFELLAHELRQDRALREKFFSRLQMLFYAGAGLAQPVWDAFDAMALETIGARIMWVTGLGATETTPSVTFTTWDGVRSGMIGLPVAGVEVKLAPVDDKLELRVRGPSITPGYWREPALTRAAFDAEGFYRMGDGVRFVDAADPRQGLRFDGRIAEDFKLSSGTWVNVGPLRAKVIAAGAPLVQDVVIAGLNRDALTALVFPNLEACRAIATDLPPRAPIAVVATDVSVRARFQALVDTLGRDATGSATRIARAIVLDELPSLDSGEITDKGSINQRAVLERRAHLVEELYAQPPSARVIVASDSVGRADTKKR